MIPPSSRPRIPIGLAVAVTVVLTAAGALATAALLAGDPAQPRRLGPALAVAVVSAVERDVEPGATMEVGDLSDGFDRAALERAAALEEASVLPPDAYAGRDWGLNEAELMPPPTPVQTETSPMQAYRAVVDRGVVRDILDDGSRVFGFDRPRPDFAAERAERWARREAEADRAASRDPGPASDSESGPIPYEVAVQSSRPNRPQ